MAAGIGERSFVLLAAVPPPASLAIAAHNRLAGEYHVRGEFEPRIDSEYAVETGSQLPIGGQESNAILLAKLALDAGHPLQTAAARQFPGRAVVRRKQSNRPSSHFSGEPEPILRIHNPAGEEEFLGRVEKRRIL